MDSRPFAPSRLNKTTAADYSSSASESEDEHRMPGVDPEDDDFGDFNPRKKRRLGGDNKERAALGIFASDSEDEGPGKKWKQKNLRSRGMNFVSKAADTKGSDQDEDDDYKPVLGNGFMNPHMDEDDDDDEEEDEEDEGNTRGVGLGFGRGTGGLGSRPQMSFQKAASPEGPAAPKTTFDGSNVLGQGFVPSSTYEPVLKDPSGGKSPPRNTPQVSSFGAKSKGKGKAMGFGAKMMAKMGYVEGQGLGKEGQGRNIIIEANLRPQGAGLGAVKEKSQQERLEEKRQARMRGEEVVDSDEEEKKKRKRKGAKGKTIVGAFDSASSTPRRAKTKYLTAEELKAAAPGLHIPDAFTPILDMTGPGGKMLTSASGIMTPTGGVPESTEVVEARRLVKRAQADLLAFSEEWRSLEERKSWVDLELREREKEVEELRGDFEKLRVFSELVQRELVSATEWEQVISCLRKPVEAGAATADLSDLAVAAIHPFLRDAEWDPLAEPTKFATDLSGITGLLLKPANDRRAVSKWDSAAAHDDDDVYRAHERTTTAYESMMYKVWLPRVLGAVRAWDPVEPTGMLTLVESWNDLLPPFVRAQVLEAVVRRLEDELSSWNPARRSSTSSSKKRHDQHLPHTWLFPWLQYLPAYHLDPRGTGLVVGVKRKFRQLLAAWEYERGVVPGLTRWEEVLGSEWRPLVMSHVLPAMGRYLATHFRVDPADQEPYLGVLTGILGWEGVVGRRALGEVLAQKLMPMWRARLDEWLALEEANLAEVAEWYTWWRGVVLADFAGAKEVGEQLDGGMRAMNVV